MFLCYKSIFSLYCIFCIVFFCVIIHFLLSLTLSFLFIQLWIKSYLYVLKCYLLFLEFSSSSRFSFFLFFMLLLSCFFILFLRIFSFFFFFCYLCIFVIRDSFSLLRRRLSSVVAGISFPNVEIFLSPNSITVERNLASHSLRRGKDRKSDRMFTRHWTGIDDVHGSTLNRKEIPRNVYGSLDSRQEWLWRKWPTSDH